MRVFYDDNNFVREAVSYESTMTNSWSNEVVVIGFTESVLLDEYYLPQYKIVDGVPVAVTDPADYQVDQQLWSLYLSKLHDEVKVLVTTKTNAELKIIYDSSPTYKKEAIGEGINSYWWGKLQQTTINMTYEIVHRVMGELLYIQQVEQRALTEEERAGVNQMLTMLHEHNGILNLPLAADAWYVSYFHNMLDTSNTIRASHIPQRIEVMGETDGQLYK